LSRGRPRGRFAARGATALAALACAAACAQADAQEPPSVTPYRPSVSTPAELSAPGYLEFELGALQTPAPQRRDSLPYAAKLAFDEDWGLRVAGEAWVRTRDAAGAVRSGAGDTSVVLKHRLDLDELSALGVELGWQIPTGRAGLGAGTAAATVNAIYSRDVGAAHIDINLNATRNDVTLPATGRVATGWAAALSRALDERWEVCGEVSGMNQRGPGSASQALAALSYTVSRALVLDAGLAASLHAGSAGPSIFFGFTALGPRLF
jgi:hypothetical protein